MRFLVPLLGALLLSACSGDLSDAPPKKAKAPAPVTGRQAFQQTFPSARIWAADCQPVHIRSLILEEMKPEGGKAGAWEVTFVSQTRGRLKAFTWSAIEAGGSLHQGVFAGPEESWSGPSPAQRPFPAAAIKTDTPEALDIAIARSAEYLRTPGTHPPVNFELAATSRFPDPAWRVLWGSSASSAEYSVFVDATTGAYLQKVR